MKFEKVSELPTEYVVGVDYEHEHRDAEHEHEEDKEPEPRIAPKHATPFLSKSMLRDSQRSSGNQLRAKLMRVQIGMLDQG